MNLGRRGFLAGGCALCAAKLMACTPTDGSGRPLTGIDGNADLAPRVAPGVRTRVSDTLDDGVRAQVDRLERNVRGSRFLIREAKANAYVQGIVTRLAGDYAKDLRPYILRVPEFNASQYPNGMMHIWTGLMIRCTNEAQLAAVLGHEIAHYTRAHGIVGMNRRVQAIDMAQVLAFVFAGVGVAQANELTNFIMVASIMSYGRDQEREADEIGVRLMAEHGLAPVEAARNWEFVTAEMQARNIPRHFSLLESSHPGDTERAQSLRHRAAELPKGESRSVEYREGLSALREILFEDQVRTGAHAATILIADRWLEDDRRDGLALYAKGESHRQRGRTEDDKEAVAALSAAIEDSRAPAVAWRSLGLLRRKLGQESEARELLNDYLRRAPGAHDRELIRRSLTS